MNVWLYGLYRIINYAFNNFMIFSKLFCISPLRFLSWYDQLWPAALPAVVAVPRVTARGSASY